MARPILKRGFGPHLSEGQRKLWLWVVAEHGGEQAAAARALGCGSALLNRWLYGFGRPGLRYLDPVRVATSATTADFRKPPTGSFPRQKLEAFAQEVRNASAGQPGG